MRRLQVLGLACAFGFAAFSATTPASAETTIKAVGTWGNLTNYTKHEGPFWSKGLAEATGGKLKGEIKPQTELGLKGFEIMRLLKQGVFDYAHGVMGYVSAENAMFDGVDLSSLAQDIGTERKVVDAYMPYMAKKFEEIYDSKLMQLYPFPSQMLWCNAEIKSIDDLKGKKIRTYTASLADFVQGVGGTSVTVAFAEVIPALQKGVVDCGITGTMPAYNAKWYQAATHAYTMRVGWGLAFGAINMKKWKSMSKADQASLKSAIDKLTEEMWTETATEDSVAVQCLTGKDCPIGPVGGMKLVTPSADDIVKQKKIAQDVVVANWAKRCDDECVATWNKVVGPIVGVTAKK
jgi:TRAP-type C4-dicarboxylate transport system substrate-binding protein